MRGAKAGAELDPALPETQARALAAVRVSGAGKVLLPSRPPEHARCTPTPALEGTSDPSLPVQELRSQKQKVVSERERLQAELDHLRKCLALPAMHWPRGYFKGYPR